MALRIGTIIAFAVTIIAAPAPPALPTYSYNEEPSVDSAAATAAASIAGVAVPDIPGALDPIPPVIKTDWTAITYHGSYTEPDPTVTGALSNSHLGTTLPTSPLPPNPIETTYDPNGTLNNPEVAPYTPTGDLGTNGTLPIYRVQSDFDYQSILLGLYQEWIELDLFNYIYQTFLQDDFTAAGLTESDRYLVEFMAKQEIGHATLLSNLLGGPGGATPQCTYNYPFTTLHEAFDFSQKLTRFGESGVWGFQAHLDAREVAQMLDESIATEARQQMIFRQFSGLFPMPVWFEAGIPQSWAWTLLEPYISSCPPESKRLAWQNFPALTILNQPNTSRRNASATGTNETTGFGPVAPSSDVDSSDSCIGNNITGFDCSGSISQNRSIPLRYPGRKVYLQWENPGNAVGPNNSYVTSTMVTSPQYVMWVTQLNATYSPLMNVTSMDGLNYGMTIQPDVSTFRKQFLFRTREEQC